MATWTYEVSVSGDHYMKDGSAISATIRRTSPASVSDIGLYSLDGSCTVKSNARIQVYASDVCLTFGDYFWIGTLSQNSSDHSIIEDGAGLSSSILNVGTGGQDTTIYADHPGGSGNGCYLKHNLVFTITIGVTSKYDTSSISCSSPIDFGNSSTITFSNPKLGELNHLVTWKINDTYQSHMTTATGASSAVFQIPMDWLATCPDRTAIECTVTVETLYNSNSIGTTSKVISLNVPANVVPTIQYLWNLQYNPENQFVINSGRFIQNLVGAKIAVGGVVAGQGSYIVSYTCFSTSEDEGRQNENEYIIDKLTHSGNVSFTIVATDARGRTASVSSTITVIPYNDPVITAYDAYRCMANGTGSENGTYAAIRCAASVSPITFDGAAHNTMTIQSYYYISTTGEPQLTLALDNMTSGSLYVIGGGLSNSYRYYVRFIVTDAMGHTAQTDVIISSAAYAIHVKNGGTGVAFGKTSEISNSVEINTGWNLYYKGFQMPPIVYSATDAPANPVTGLIWLKKK